MGNPAGDRRKLRTKRRLKQERRLAEKRAEMEARAEQSIWPVLTAPPTDSDGPEERAVRAVYRAAVDLSEKLGLFDNEDHPPPGRALPREIARAVLSVSFDPTDPISGPIRISMRSDALGAWKAIEEAARAALAAPFLFEIELADPPALGGPAGGLPPVGAGDESEAQFPPELQNLRRQWARGPTAPSRTIVGGHPIDSEHPPGGGPPVWWGTVTVGARSRPRGAAHRLITAGHVGRAIAASVHHPAFPMGSRVADVDAIALAPPPPARPVDAARAIMRSGWRAAPWIERVGPVVATGAPSPGTTYVVLGRRLGPAYAVALRHFGVAQRFTLHDGRTLTVFDFFRFRFNPSHPHGIRVGDSGGPVYEEIPGDPGVRLVGMILGFDPRNPQEFFVTPWPAAAGALGVRVP